MCTGNYKTYPYLPLHHLWLQKEVFHLKTINMAFYYNCIETKTFIHNYMYICLNLEQYACVEEYRDVEREIHKNSEQIFIPQYLCLRGKNQTAIHMIEKKIQQL